METLNAVGVYSFEGGYGVWGSMKVAISTRHLPMDVKITPPTLNNEEANILARQIHAMQVQPCELLPF